jgi:hypothetical protein
MAKNASPLLTCPPETILREMRDMVRLMANHGRVGRTLLEMGIGILLRGFSL